MNWKKIQNRLLVFTHDALMVCVAWFGAYWLRFNLSVIPPETFSRALHLLPIVFCIQIAALFYVGLYRGVWRYASVHDVMRIVKATAIGICLCVLSAFVYTRLHGVPRSVFPLYGLLLIGFLSGPRLLYRTLREPKNFWSTGERVLIVGAGQAGESLARELLRERSVACTPVAFVDDARHKQGQEIHGIRVAGRCRDIAEIVKTHGIDLIFIAVPSANSVSMRRVVRFCEKAKVPFRTLPNVSDLTAGRVTINALRDVSLEDLLGRDQVELDWQAIREALQARTVLVTGGGGSIGAELCRQIARLKPSQLIVVDNSEYNLYRIEHELKTHAPEVASTFYLASVTDHTAIQRVMQAHQPGIVFHAAAYKHVPLLEHQARVAVLNNVMGTRVVAEAALASGVAHFVLISTDKAVNPANVMGATKRAAEIFCQNLNAKGQTKFITVRFGNVLGSAGSVVPLFREQLKQGGPLTVTHPDITRYFMTIPEACQLILQAMVLGRGGEIYVLDMGEPIKINYLAEQMIRLSGKKVGEEIEIVYTGLRPGEKLYEELFHAREKLLPTPHEKILKAQFRERNWEDLMRLMAQCEQVCEAQDEVALQAMLKQLVPDYQAPAALVESEEVVE